MASLSLVEEFISIQGEGKYQGHLGIFLRFFGCNLNCYGFDVKQISNKTGDTLIGCDTIRAVFTSHFDATQIQTEDEILNLVNARIKDLKKLPMIVITGGEPLLYHKNKIFINLVSKLIDSGFKIQFETNSSIFVDFEKFPIYKKCSFAMSVKLKNSGEKYEKRINKEAIKAICENSYDSFYKFVILGKDKELDEINDILKIYNQDVWCMPMGSNKIELEKNALNVANFAIKNGFNYSDRMHIRIWDDKEGV
ncbi:7-carboxy-7-deazaguanine synthase [Campylobacter pinnipediorum subsp. pinnipediorum]|nr:7-carboxy-7-deazaguanine synthase [Campylobacter pinnipediorum subsp. pinnipediorum]